MGSLLTRRLDRLEEAIGEPAGRCPRHLWTVVQVLEGQSWPGTRARCSCGALAGLALVEIGAGIKPSTWRHACLGAVQAALGVLTDAELTALEAVAKREWVAETEGEAEAVARYDHVAELIGQAEAAGGELVVRMPHYGRKMQTP